MSGEIASAFVRIRPNMAGFRGEVEGGVRDAFKGVGRTIGGALAATGAFEFAKGIVEAAAADQAAFVILDKAIKNAKASTDLLGGSVEDILKKEGRLKGFNDEQLAAAFTRLVSVTHNSAKAYSDLGLAEDLARARGLDLATAALAIGKAEQGRTTSLQRYGLIVPKVTTAEDALIKKHNEAVAAGAKFTAAQNQAYAAALKVAKAQDQQGQRTEALTLIQQRFGGVSDEFAKTAAGSFARFQESVHLLEETLGKAFLPTLANAAQGIGNFAGDLSQNKDFVDQLQQAVHGVSEVLGEIGQVARVVGPPILTLSKDLGGLVRVLEIATAVVAGRKIIGYLEGITAAGGKTVAADGAMSAATTIYTAALDANTAALLANTAAQTADNIAKEVQILDRFGNVLTTVKTGEAEAAAGAEKLGGSIGGAAGKVAALSGFLAKSIGLLVRFGGAYLAANQITKLLPGQHDLGLDFSNNTAKFTNGDNGSPFQKGSGDDALYQRGYQRRSNPVSHKELFSARNAVAVAEESAYDLGVKNAIKAGRPDASAAVFDLLAGAWEDGVRKFAEDTVSGKLARQGKTATDKAISQLRASISLDKSSLTDLNQQIQQQAEQGPDSITAAFASAKGNFTQIGQTIAADIDAVVQQPFVVAEQNLTAAGDRLSLEFDRQSARLQARSTAINNQLGQIAQQQQARTARFAGESARISNAEGGIGLRQDQLTLEQLRRQVILPGGKTLSGDNDQALRQLNRFAGSAKGASKLAIQEFTAQFEQAVFSVEKDKIGIATQISPKQAQRQADLQVSAGRTQLKQAIVDAKRASIEARQQIQADIIRIGVDVATARARVAAREIADLTDAFNRAPSPAALRRVTKKIADIMAADHVSFRTAGAQLGSAFANGFQGQITGLGLQGQALVGIKGPPGGGLIPAITKPLETIQQQQLQAANLARQQRRVQLDESKKQTKLLGLIHASQTAKKFIDSLGQNPGKQTKTTKQLAGTTG